MQENVYKTKQRSAILDCLKSNCEKALTVDEITDRMKANGYPVGKTTVYRYIDKLVKEGQVRKFVPENGKSAAFQFIEHHKSCSEHIHLKCLGCGKFIHLDCKLMHSANQHILKNHGFMVDNSKSLLFGFCENCLSTFISKEEAYVTD